MVWNKQRWIPVEKTKYMIEYVKELVKEIRNKANQQTRTEDANKLLAQAMSLESNKKMLACLETAMTDPRIFVQPEIFDRNPWLFNVQNGTINLKWDDSEGGKLREHRREDMITKISPAYYDKNARCPTWDKFMTDLFGEHPGIINYWQRKYGYIMTGDTREQEFDVLFGSGSNGKSTQVGAIIYIMGEYHERISINTIQETRAQLNGANASPNIACLKGKRFVTASEPKKGLVLDMAIIKDFTGKDPVSARALHQDPFVFIPEFKLSLATNFEPIIKTQDKGTWRRVKKIPYDKSFDTPDKFLDQKLIAESSGILNWMIEGCLKWQRTGLQVPDEIIEATNEYKADMDLLAEFWDVCTERYANNPTHYKILYTVYSLWCEANDMRPENKNAFSRTVQSRGYGKKRAMVDGIQDAAVIGMRIKSRPLEIAIRYRVNPAAEHDWAVEEFQKWDSWKPDGKPMPVIMTNTHNNYGYIIRELDDEFGMLSPQERHERRIEIEHTVRIIWPEVEDNGDLEQFVNGYCVWEKK